MGADPFATIREYISNRNLIQKSKQYLKPGEKPPEGVQVQRGTRGKYYYNTEDRKGKSRNPKQDPHEAMAAASVSVHLHKEVAKKFPDMDKDIRIRATKKVMEYIQNSPGSLDMKVDYLKRTASGKNSNVSSPEEIAAAQVLLNRFQRKMGVGETRF